MKPGTSKESAAPGGQATATGKAPEVTHSHSVTSDRLQEADPLLAWFGLAAGVKPSRLRQMKRGWQRKVGK